MTLVGIDPSLREKGLAVCFIKNKELFFKIYKEYVDFIFDLDKWYLIDNEFTVMIEDSSLQNVTFPRGANYQTSLSISRKVGMNQAASLIAIALCKKHGFITHNISPKDKGSKWTLNLMKLVINENQFITNQSKFSQDEIDAFTLAYILKLNENETTNSRWNNRK